MYAVDGEGEQRVLQPRPSFGRPTAYNQPMMLHLERPPPERDPATGRPLVVSDYTQDGQAVFARYALTRALSHRRRREGAGVRSRPLL